MSTHVLQQFVQKYGRLPTELDPDYLEMLNMSKYHVLQVPHYKPGKCANCGASRGDDNRKYIDFGLEIDWYGQVYLCGFCLLDIAKNVGLFREYEARIERLETELHAVKALNDRGAQLEATVLKTFDEVREHFAGLHTSPLDTSADSSPDMESDKEESSGSGSDKVQQGTKGTQRGVAKPVTSTGSKNFRSLADLLDK